MKADRAGQLVVVNEEAILIEKHMSFFHFDVDMAQAKDTDLE